MGDAVAVGVDVGATKLLAVTVASDGTALERQRRTSPRRDPAALVAAVRDAARELGTGLPVGVGAAGIVSRDGVLRYGPNLEVSDLPLRSRLSDDLAVPVVVANDATVALYGELRAGAARGARDVVMLTLGTGVGGAIVVEGRLVYGAGGMAGELGHIIVADGGRRCPCGNRGCLEAYASGTAIGARAAELLAGSDEPTSLRDADPLDGRAVTLAALGGDRLGQRILREAGYWLGVGLTGIVNALDPELVVVGGGAAPTAAPYLLPAAAEVVSERLLGREHRTLPPMVLATLADDAGAIGAGLLAAEEGGA
ncbi:MAG TPA: ROK family protein [Nitriliruptorales bacterium]|nr:ROK family protein [Nitriliruptorales bacterium]